ncbi:NAD(P)/FAD-dependent oxidoreductase [Arthrobacter pigmenti]
MLPDHTSSPDLPVIVIGSGPVGLAAAAQLVERANAFTLLEAGNRIADSMQAWGHVQLFSPWRFNIDPAARRLLERSGWAGPKDDHLPTGSEMVDDYLRPLAELPEIAGNMRFGARVSAISRDGIDRARTPGRQAAPFVVRLNSGEEIAARAVIDASGTWTTPNVLGASGLPAHGELLADEQIEHALPDVLGAERQSYAGKHTVVVGAGHSAATTLLALARLADEEPGTQVSWAIRADDPSRSFGGGSDDELPARGELGAGLKLLVNAGRIRLVTGFRTHTVQLIGEGAGESRVQLISMTSSGAGKSITADRIVAATGYRPDLSIAGELRVDFDPILSAPKPLAPLIDPNQHSCGTVPPHGVDELAHPEPGYFVVGMKSYGRAPTFLMATGYEQVRSIVAALDGDWKAARQLQLELPETGVCSVTAGSEAIAVQAGMTAAEHTELMQAVSKHLPLASSAAGAVHAAASELGIEEATALELSAYAAEQFDQTPVAGAI